MGLLDPPSYSRAQADQRYGRVIQLPASNGTDDTAALNAILTAAPAGSTIRGLSGTTYLTTGPLYAPANCALDMAGATVKAKDGSAGHYLLRPAGMLAAVLAPGALVATPSTSSGSLAAGAYAYVVTATTATAETVPCQYAAATLAGAGNVTLAWSAPLTGPNAPAVTGYKVYGRTSGGATLLLGTVAAGALTFTDTGAAGTAATPPISNGTIARTPGIRIVRGTWDANWQNVTVTANNSWQSSGWVGHGLEFQKVDGLRLDSPTVLNAYKWAVAVADFTDLRTEGVTLNTRSDGIHVLGPGDSWVARGTRGTTGDDMHGVSLAEWPNQAVSAGSIGSVTIEDANGSGVPSFLRVLGSAGYKLGSLTVDKIRGTYLGTFTGGVYISDDQPTGGSPNGTDIDKVTIRDVNVTITGAGTSPPVFVGGRNLKHVTVSDIYCDDPQPVQAVMVSKGAGGSASTQVIGNLLISKVTRVAYAANQTAVTLTSGVTVATTQLDQVSLIGGNFTASAVQIGQSGLAEIAIRQLRYTAAAGTGTAINITGSGSASIGRLSIVDPYMDLGYRLLDIAMTTASVFSVLVTGGRLVSVGELLRVLQASGTVYVNCRDVRVEAMTTTGAVNAGTSSSVVLAGGGNFLPNGKNMMAVSSPTLTRVNGPDMRIDLGQAALTPLDGDLAYNTNGTLGCGIGPVVYNATAAKWKGLYSGLTN